MSFMPQPYPLYLVDWNAGAAAKALIIGWHGTGGPAASGSDRADLQPIVVAIERDGGPTGPPERWDMAGIGPYWISANLEDLDRSVATYRQGQTSGRAPEGPPAS